MKPSDHIKATAPSGAQDINWGDFRDHLATADKQGRRMWVYPKKPKGRFYLTRLSFSFVLILIMFAGPFIKIQGNPLLMINIVERKFSLFGVIFWPQDNLIFAFGFLLFLTGIAVFTAAFGRLWCGWTCPQTVMMEMVFRRLEYFIEGSAQAQRALNNGPWTANKILRKLAKHTVFLGLSFVIGNTLLAYIIGIEPLLAIVTDDPANHATGLFFMCVFTLIFYTIFARFREQACTFICPYGRLQSTLLDENSIVVAYDYKRGEQRGTYGSRRREKADLAPAPELAAGSRPDWHAGMRASTVEAAILAASQGGFQPRVQEFQGTAASRAPHVGGYGDCIDCHQCVAVCPTGIDIRNGTQMECVNCTACIDACDAVMAKIGKPRGLVRFASLNGIERGERLRITPRIIGYCVVLTLLGLGLLTLLITRKDMDTTLLRAPGGLFQTTTEGRINNLYLVKLTNKTQHDMPIELKLENIEGTLEVSGGHSFVPAEKQIETSVLVQIDPAKLSASSTPLVVGVYSDGKKLETLKTVFIGPRK